MCKVHKRRNRADYGWREVREREEDGCESAAKKGVVDFDPTDPEDIGGVVVDTSVDIDLSD